MNHAGWVYGPIGLGHGDVLTDVNLVCLSHLLIYLNKIDVVILLSQSALIVSQINWLFDKTTFLHEIENLEGYCVKFYSL